MTGGRPACPDCGAGHDHCHDTLVVHTDGALECVGATACEEIEERHPLVLDCRELAPQCGCSA